MGDIMPLKKYSFWVEESQLEGLRFVADRDGIRESEQIRRAVNAWLETKGVTLAGSGQGAVGRKRPSPGAGRKRQTRANK